MRPCAVACLAVLLAFASMANAQESCGPRQVALTFDDPPRDGTVVMSGEERTRRIIEALRDAGGRQAMFFAVSSHIDDDNRARMHAYAGAGHAVASHSHTHPNLHRVGSDAFIADIRTADSLLSPMPGFIPFFRFPYLNEGDSAADRDEVRAALRDLGYRPGYVTIDNFDFHIDALLREAVAAEEDVDFDAVGDLYVDMIMGAARHYDAVACRWLGRSPRHVLLLHENDIAALFLPRLISAFEAEGWAIIDAVDAYDDPIAEIEPDTLFLGQGQVAALAHVAGADPASLRHAGEDTAMLDAAFRRAIGDGGN